MSDSFDDEETLFNLEDESEDDSSLEENKTDELPITSEPRFQFRSYKVKRTLRQQEVWAERVTKERD